MLEPLRENDVPVSAVPLLLSTSLQRYLYAAAGLLPVGETFPPHMDTSKRHLTFPQPPPTRARCPRSLPRLVTPTAWAGQNCCDVGGETPATPTVTVGGPDDGADRGLSNHVVTFSTFLSAGSTVLRVTRTGNHPSPTTAAKILLTEIGDVCLIPPPRPPARRPPQSSNRARITGIDAAAGLYLGGEERVRRW